MATCPQHPSCANSTVIFDDQGNCICMYTACPGGGTYYGPCLP